MRLALSILFLFAVSLNAWAINGSQFISFCKNIETNEFANSFNNGFCSGFIIGLDTGHISFTEGHPKQQNQKIYCAPEPGSEGYYTQLIKVIGRYLEEHPEKLHLEITETASTALEEAFPCN